MNESARFKKELLSREYGSNVVRIVDQISQNPDKTERTNQSKLLIKLIEKMNPAIKYTENFEDILWGHLYVLSNMTLDVDVEFSKPDTNVTKPEKVVYPDQKPKYKHYGKNVDILGKELAKLTDEEDKKEASIAYGKLLKTLYSNWNNNSVGDRLIAFNVEELSQKNLKVDPALINEDGSDSPFYTKRRQSTSNRTNNQRNTNNRNNNNRNNNNNNRNNSNYNNRKKYSN